MTESTQLPAELPCLWSLAIADSTVSFLLHELPFLFLFSLVHLQSKSTHEALI
ncbi:hypothetical protein Hanom_Chr17g01540181 [Helianthus anomalus]